MRLHPINSLLNFKYKNVCIKNTDKYKKNSNFTTGIDVISIRRESTIIKNELYTKKIYTVLVTGYFCLQDFTLLDFILCFNL